MFVSYKLRGSAENKLKVLKPNEFDVDVLMKMPIREERDDSVKVWVDKQFKLLMSILNAPDSFMKS